jgi:FKBP-type peptidyl-prolyl cis-trans isomerase FkpA
MKVGEINKTTMKRKLLAAAVIVVAFIAVSCDPSKKYEEEEKSLIADYIARNNITVAPDAKGLYYMEITPGEGDPIQEGDSVGVYYKGMFLNGDEFDTNMEESTPFRFRVGSYYIIEGWSRALTYMKLHTTAKVLLPSSLAYGPSGYGYYDSYGYYHSVIGGYTPLLFEMEVAELVRARK